MSLISTSTGLPNPAQFEGAIHRFLSEFRFEGPKPSLEHISTIARYFSRLPYENISKILKYNQVKTGQLFRLPDELTEDHFAWHLGGTCFSLTYFLQGIFTLSGYETHPIICDLNWGKNNHSAVQIRHGDSRFLVDPGYMIFKAIPLGQKTIRSRISAETGIELRYDSSTELYSLYTYRHKQFIRRYQFKDQAVSLDDFSRFWTESFELPGMDDLTLTRVEGYEMLYVQGDFVKVTSPEHIEKIREMDMAEKMIKERFKIPLEKIEEARYVIKQRTP